MKNKIIKHSLIDAQALLKEIVQTRPLLVLKKLTSTNFHIVSKENYGQLSLVEKEYYTIKGKIKAINQGTQISYKVSPNATFRTFSIIFPIMFLPTLIIGSTVGNTEKLLTNLLIYVLVCGVVILFLLNQEKQLKVKGEREFEVFLNLLDS